MSESDIQIGFDKQPADLEGFLEEQGYFLDDDDDTLQSYEHSAGRGPTIYYYSGIVKLSDVDEESGCLDWGKSGYKVVSELDITFFPSNSDETDEAVRLSREIVRRLDGILYDSYLDEFFRKDAL